MKRSEINKAIKWAKDLLKKEHITLPEFAYWSLDEWRNNDKITGDIKDIMLGWDVTDYGMDKYSEVGGVLFTVRNGDLKNANLGVPYAEKYILLEDGQALPTHFHYSKTEDIINRAGGILALQLHNSKEDNSIDLVNDVVVYMDSIKHIVKAGETVKVLPGSSITLTPGMYHNFWALEGHGDLVVGEVSSVNDDNIDNHFNPLIPRFGDIEEDESMEFVLCNEYDRLNK